MARTNIVALVLMAMVAVMEPAGGDPSGYLEPAGEARTVAKAARLFRDGVRLLDKGSTGTALGKFRDAAKLCPDFFEARYNLAKLKGDRGGRERAVAELEAVCRDFPMNVRAFNDLGQLLVATDADAAGNAFETATANGEKLLEDEAILGAGKNTIAQLRADLAFACHNRGAWRLGRSEFEGAEADLRRSIELSEANFFSHYALGLALLQQGKYTEARTAFKRAKALKRPFADCSIGLARSYLGETPPQPAAAIAELTEAERAGVATAELETLYGDCHRLLGRFEAASERYAKALELGADRVTISLKQAVVARDQGALERARELLDECLELTEEPPLRSRAHRHLGELDELAEHFEAAAAHFAKAVELDPAALGARLHLGACLYRLGRAEEAAEHLAAVIAEVGDAPPAALAADLALARKLLDKIRSPAQNKTHTE